MDAQTGWAMILKSSNSDDGAPWSVTEHVTVSNNIIRHAANGVMLISWNFVYPSLHANHIAITNNVFYDIGTPQWALNSYGISTLLVTGDVNDVTFEHNTSIQTPSIDEGRAVTGDGDVSQRFIYRNNIAPYHTYGVFGGGVGSGQAALDSYFPGAVLTTTFLRKAMRSPTHIYIQRETSFWLRSRM